MVSNEFLEFIGAFATPERTQVFRSAITLLFKLGNSNIEDALDQLLNEPDHGSEDAFLATADAILTGAVTATLSLFGVTVVPDTPLKPCSDLLEALTRMEDWEEPGSLLAKASVDESPEAVLCDLCEYVGCGDSSELIDQVERVSPSLIERLECVLKERIARASGPDAVAQRATRRVSIYLTMAKPPIFSQALREMLRMGQDFKKATDPYEEAISALKYEAAIPELVGFALASALPDEGLNEAIQQEAKGWWDDTVTAPSKIQNLIQMLLQEVLNHGPLDSQA